MIYLCLKIFFIRIIDVSLGTFVTVLTVKNKRLLATIIGFFDVILWYLVVRAAINTSVNSFWVAISYASGYATGTFIGTILSNELINTKLSIQIIFNKISKKNIKRITDSGYALSIVECMGINNTKKKMVFIEIDKKNMKELLKIVKEIDNKAFIIINESKYAINGYFK